MYNLAPKLLTLLSAFMLFAAGMSAQTSVKGQVKDAEGNIAKLICTIDTESRGGNAPDGRKVKGTIHWVSADHAREAVAPRVITDGVCSAAASRTTSGALS